MPNGTTDPSVYCSHIVDGEEPVVAVLVIDHTNFVLCLECINSVRGQVLGELATNAFTREIKDAMKLVKFKPS
ncbi:MAG TPA: hypothetical protein PKD55_00235 [Bellilinea sp.]|nr:hypothetical protein [Bellilinea sp.]